LPEKSTKVDHYAKIDIFVHFGSNGSNGAQWTEWNVGKNMPWKMVHYFPFLYMNEGKINLMFISWRSIYTLLYMNEETNKLDVHP
jgi:hypothetical protein